MLTTPTIMLKLPYFSLSLLFGPLKRAQIIYNIFVSYKKTKMKNNWCVGLCSTPLVRSIWSLVGLWIVCWDDCSPCALSFASLVIFVAPNLDKELFPSWDDPATDFTFRLGKMLVSPNSHNPLCFRWHGGVLQMLPTMAPSLHKICERFKVDAISPRNPFPRPHCWWATRWMQIPPHLWLCTRCLTYFPANSSLSDPMTTMDDPQTPISNWACVLFQLLSRVEVKMGSSTVFFEHLWWLFTASAPRLSEVITIPKEWYRPHKEKWIIKYNNR